MTKTGWAVQWAASIGLLVGAFGLPQHVSAQPPTTSMISRYSPFTAQCPTYALEIGEETNNVAECQDPVGGIYRVLQRPEGQYLSFGGTRANARFGWVYLNSSPKAGANIEWMFDGEGEAKPSAAVLRHVTEDAGTNVEYLAVFRLDDVRTSCLVAAVRASGNPAANDEARAFAKASGAFRCGVDQVRTEGLSVATGGVFWATAPATSVAEVVAKGGGGAHVRATPYLLSCQSYTVEMSMADPNVRCGDSTGGTLCEATSVRPVKVSECTDAVGGTYRVMHHPFEGDLLSFGESRETATGGIAGASPKLGTSFEWVFVGDDLQGPAAVTLLHTSNLGGQISELYGVYRLDAGGAGCVAAVVPSVGNPKAKQQARELATGFAQSFRCGHDKVLVAEVQIEPGLASPKDRPIGLNADGDLSPIGVLFVALSAVVMVGALLAFNLALRRRRNARNNAGDSKNPEQSRSRPAETSGNANAVDVGAVSLTKLQKSRLLRTALLADDVNDSGVSVSVHYVDGRVENDHTVFLLAEGVLDKFGGNASRKLRRTDLYPELTGTPLVKILLQPAGEGIFRGFDAKAPFEWVGSCVFEYGTRRKNEMRGVVRFREDIVTDDGEQIVSRVLGMLKRSGVKKIVMADREVFDVRYPDAVRFTTDTSKS